jgi:hypothetical protein
MLAPSIREPRPWSLGSVVFRQNIIARSIWQNGISQLVVKRKGLGTRYILLGHIPSDLLPPAKQPPPNSHSAMNKVSTFFIQSPINSLQLKAKALAHESFGGYVISKS